MLSIKRLLARLRGYRTALVALVIAAAPALLDLLAGLDWSKLFGGKYATLAPAAIMIALRLVTATPFGKGEDD